MKKILTAGTLLIALCVLGLHWYTGGGATAFVRDRMFGMTGMVYTPTNTGIGFMPYFQSKRELAVENLRLKDRIEALERLTPQDRLDALSADAADTLVETLAHHKASAAGTVRVADIVSYTSYPFGTLGIRFREPLQSTTTGQLRYVFSEDGTVIGTLDSASIHTALVRLFSSPGIEHTMRIGTNEMSLVVGKGGVTLETEVPKSASIHNDDPVSLPEAGNALVGIVGEVTSKDTDTTQHVLIRLASVPTHIRSVFIVE